MGCPFSDNLNPELLGPCFGFQSCDIMIQVHHYQDYASDVKYKAIFLKKAKTKLMRIIQVHNKVVKLFKSRIFIHKWRVLHNTFQNYKKMSMISSWRRNVNSTTRGRRPLECIILIKDSSFNSSTSHRMNFILIFFELA